MNFDVKIASPEHAMAIAGIYNEGIRAGNATFETEARSAVDILAWFEDPVPIIVAAHGDDIFAFARTSAYRDRACYAHIREFSVYVVEQAQGQGAGRAVMETLIAICPRHGISKLVSRIFSDNRASLALCNTMGFRTVGIYEKHGQLAGRWHDCTIVELLIDAAD